MAFWINIRLKIKHVIIINDIAELQHHKVSEYDQELPHTNCRLTHGTLEEECFSLFCYVLLCVHSSFAIILKRKRKLDALLLLSYKCIVTINVMLLFLTVPWVGLQCVILVIPDHTHLLFSFMQPFPRQNHLFLRYHTLRTCYQTNLLSKVYRITDVMLSLKCSTFNRCLGNRMLHVIVF